MNDNLQKVLRALLNTSIFLVLGVITVIIFAITIGPFALVLGFDGPTWAGILAAIWGLVFFAFTIALLHEFE